MAHTSEGTDSDGNTHVRLTQPTTHPKERDPKNDWARKMLKDMGIALQEAIKKVFDDFSDKVDDYAKEQKTMPNPIYTNDAKEAIIKAVQPREFLYIASNRNYDNAFVKKEWEKISREANPHFKGNGEEAKKCWFYIRNDYLKAYQKERLKGIPMTRKRIPFLDIEFRRLDETQGDKAQQEGKDSQQNVLQFRPSDVNLMRPNDHTPTYAEIVAFNRPNYYPHSSNFFAPLTTESPEHSESHSELQTPMPTQSLPIRSSESVYVGKNEQYVYPYSHYQHLSGGSHAGCSTSQGAYPIMQAEQNPMAHTSEGTDSDGNTHVRLTQPTTHPKERDPKNDWARKMLKDMGIALGNALGKALQEAIKKVFDDFSDKVDDYAKGSTS